MILFPLGLSDNQISKLNKGCISHLFLKLPQNQSGFISHSSFGIRVKNAVNMSDH